VPVEAEATRFFSPHDRLYLDHLRADMFEPDGRFMDRYAVDLTEAVDHRGRRQGLDDRPAPALDFEQIVGQQAEDLQLVDETPLFVDEPDPIGIPIECDPHISAALLNDLLELGEVSVDRLGSTHTGEERVALCIDRYDLGRPPVEHRRQVARSGSIH
jgi:hypothetical protein